MKIHVPSMLAKDVETINKQTQQTSSQLAYKIQKTKYYSSHPYLEK